MTPVASPASAAGVSGTAELDLPCEREHWTTVHVLRWTINAHGQVANTSCTCRSCPTGANTRPWPTTIELQDAGAPSTVPRGDAAMTSPPARSLSDRLHASRP